VGKLDGVDLQENGRRARDNTPMDEITGHVLTDLVERLTQRFDMTNEIIEATNIANFHTWPINLDEAKGISNLSYTHDSDTNLKQSIYIYNIIY